MALNQCPECHREVSDQAASCPHCGFPFKQQPGVAEDKWETCCIEWGITSDIMGTPTAWSEHYFWAQAISPESGTYSAGCSANFTTGMRHKLLIRSTRDHRPPSWDDYAIRAFSQLVDLLVRDGWESTPIKGNQWWQQSFRRRVRSEKDGWGIFLTTSKWGGHWIGDTDPLDESEPELAEALAKGSVKKDGDMYWYEESFFIKHAQDNGAEPISIIRHGPDDSHIVTLRKLEEQTTQPEIEKR